MAEYYKVLRSNIGGKYKQIIGLTGELVDGVGCGVDTIALRFKYIDNDKSSYNVFRVKRSWTQPSTYDDYLQPIKKGNDKMAKKNSEALLVPGYKVAFVKFVNGTSNNLYSYAVYGNCSEGNLAITDKDQVAEIVSVLTLEECKERNALLPYAQLKGFIDVTDFNNRVELSKEIKEKTKFLEEKAKDIERKLYFESLANIDPKFKAEYEGYVELLNKFNNI